MKVLACMFAMFVATAPAVKDMCGLGCLQPVAPSCPLHQETPAPQPQCNHDHAGIRADVVRPLAMACPVVPSSTVAAFVAVPPAAPSLPPRADDSQSPPNFASRPIVLRI